MNVHKGWCYGWCSRGEDRAGSNRVLVRVTAPSSVEMDEVVSARPDVQADAKGRVETCQAHSSLQEIRLDKNKLSLLFFLNLSDTYTQLFVISCLELILSCTLCTSTGRKGVMVGQLIEGFHSEQPLLQVANYSLLFLAGPSLPAFQSISKHTCSCRPAAVPELMGLGLGSEGLELLGVLPPSGLPEQVRLPPATTTDREQWLLLFPILCSVVRE